MDGVRRAGPLRKARVDHRKPNHCTYTVFGRRCPPWRKAGPLPAPPAPPVMCPEGLVSRAARRGADCSYAQATPTVAPVDGRLMPSVAVPVAPELPLERRIARCPAPIPRLPNLPDAARTGAFIDSEHGRAVPRQTLKAQRMKCDSALTRNGEGSARAEDSTRLATRDHCSGRRCMLRALPAATRVSACIRCVSLHLPGETRARIAFSNRHHAELPASADPRRSVAPAKLPLEIARPYPSCHTRRGGVPVSTRPQPDEGAERVSRSGRSRSRFGPSPQCRVASDIWVFVCDARARERRRHSLIVDV